MTSTQGPSMGFDNPERLRLITDILTSLRSLETSVQMSPGTLKIDTPIWIAMWLADLPMLEVICRAFIDRPLQSLCLYNSSGFSQVLKMWVPTSGIGGNFAGSRPGSGVSTPVLRSEHSVSVGSRLTASRPAPVATTVDSSPALHAGKKHKHEEIDHPSSPIVPTSSKLGRDCTKECLTRDGVCIITKATGPLQPAHILPLTLSQTRTNTQGMNRLEFQGFLETFWSKGTIDRWIGDKKDGLMSVANLVTMSPNCHVYWDHALFGLMPVQVSEDKRSMQLQFFWLGAQDLPPTGSTLLLPGDDGERILVSPIVMPANLPTGGKERHVDGSAPNLTLFDNAAKRVIYSGDIITITTPNPHTLPLPDEGLLSLQWTLHRLAALCAAAGWKHWDAIDDDDDEDIVDPDPVARMTTPRSEEAGDRSQMNETNRFWLQERLEEAMRFPTDYGC